MQQRYEEYISRKAQESDYTRLQTVLEDLEREEDTLYIIGLIQMYKDADTYFEDDIQEGKFLASVIMTLPFFFISPKYSIFSFNLFNPYVSHCFCLEL